MLRTTGLRGALDAATTTHREELAKSGMSQTTLSLDAVSASVHVPYDVLHRLHNDILHAHYTAFDQSKISMSDGKAGSQRDCELNSRKQVTQCESGMQKRIVVQQNGVIYMVLKTLAIVANNRCTCMLDNPYKCVHVAACSMYHFSRHFL